MKITDNKTAEGFTVAIEGRLDTSTAPMLEAYAAEKTEGKLILDFEKLEYVSSAGLRVLLALHKKQMSAGNVMIVRNVCEAVAEVFEITGFSDILNIE